MSHDGKPKGRFISLDEAQGKDVEYHPDIHDFFNLSYANYLVLNRTVLQSMPDDWQKDFVQMLGELSKEMGWAMELQPAINVQILRRERERLYNETETCPTCTGTGLDPDSDLEDEVCEECDGDGEIEVESDRFETIEEVGIREDPIPNYSRGRTKIPLASMSIEEAGDYSHWRLYDEWLKANHRDEWHKICGPQFQDGEAVKVNRFTFGHALPLALEEIPHLGFFTGKIVEVVKGSDNLLFIVDVKMEDPNAVLHEPDELRVQLHVEQMQKDS